MKIKTGQASNIPWWRLQTMSDEEIEKQSFMMIENLPEVVNDIGECVGNMEFPFTKIREEDKAALMAAYAEESILKREVWNAAIEACVEYCYNNGYDMWRLRSLKK